MLHLMIRDGGVVQVHAKIIDKNVHFFLSWTKLYLGHRFFNDLWSLKKEPKGRGPRPLEDRKLQDQNINNVYITKCVVKN